MSTVPTMPSASISKTPILALVYLSFLLDNVLLTVVVPIVPVYLISVEESGRPGVKNQLLENNSSHIQNFVEENGRVGLLLSSKAVVQLIINPLVGFAARYTGYTLPLFVGSVNLLSSSLLFACGESYISLFFARSLQGFASACIGVSGMCLVAEQCQTEGSRSRVMGVVLGSVALGVLLGYPFGSFLYDFVGKTAPFVAIGLLAFVNIGFQLSYLDLKPPGKIDSGPESSWPELMSDGLIMVTAGAIWVSTSAMAVLEPCLPLWLLTTLKPEGSAVTSVFDLIGQQAVFPLNTFSVLTIVTSKWELGTVFIPDSVGYLIGTNFFGPLAYRVGRWRMAIGAMLLVAVSALMIPTVQTIRGLAAPHFGLGLGIGAADAALVPLLATLVDTRHSANYAVVYALQQTAVSLAYSLGPMIGGELAHFIGFPGLMRCIGVANLLFCPLLALLSTTVKKEESVHVAATQVLNYSTTQKYNKFSNAEDSD